MPFLVMIKQVQPMRYQFPVLLIKNELGPSNRAAQNLKIFDLILTSKFEVFRGLSSKNLDITNLYYPQNLILNLKTAVLILTSNFEVFFEDPQ